MTSNIPQSSSNRLKYAALMTGGWILLSALTAAQVYFGLSGNGQAPFSYGQLLPMHLAGWLPWLLISPFIFYFGRRYPIVPGQWKTAFTVHLPISIVLVLFYVLAINIISSLFESVPLFSNRFNANYKTILLMTFHWDLMTYWLILAGAHAFYFYRNQRTQNQYQASMDLPEDVSKITIGKSKQEYQPLSKLVIKNAGDVVLLNTNEIDWIEAADYYVQIHANGKQHLLRKTMKEMAQNLDSRQFIRIHRSTIVNIDRIRKMVPGDHGDYYVILHNGKELKLSRHRREQLQTVLGQSI